MYSRDSSLRGNLARDAWSSNSFHVLERRVSSGPRADGTAPYLNLLVIKTPDCGLPLLILSIYRNTGDKVLAWPSVWDPVDAA